MAWDEIEIEDAKAGGNHTGVSVGLVKMRATVPAQLRITFKAEAFAKTGLSENDHLVVLLGSGEDFGMVRLRKDKAGKLRVRRREAAHNAVFYEVNLKHRPEFVDRTQKAMPCQWEQIDFCTIEIVLPPWADETNPQRVRARIPAVPATVAAGKADQTRRMLEAREAEERRAAREKEDIASEVEKVLSAGIRDVPRWKIDLPPLQSDILALLWKYRGRAVTRDALMLVIYGGRGDNVPDDKIVDVHISKLRTRLPIGASISCIRGVGWTLEGDLSGIIADAETAA